ncbi:MAG TPA: segregation/condensation protein A [Candidatus Nanoarchaeia archaeon]|nr:segregation/condensation protein A [Candidatus Nanoarchaeia archaeon]
MQERIFDLLLNQDELNWKNIIYDLVKTEQMDPWDIDLSLLSQKFIQIIKEMQEHDFKIPGKILLAAAVLLKIKATHLIENDISNLDKLINQHDGIPEEELFEEMEQRLRNPDTAHPQLIPRNPQPRNRKVSVEDLIEALQRALATKKRILAQQRPVKFPMPKRKIDILEVIRDIYHKINYYTDKDPTQKLTYTRLLPPRASKQEKVYTFMPLLHLENEHKIEMQQQNHFDEIVITVTKREKK